MNLLAVTDKSLRPFYKDAFRRVVREKTVWDWEYECSSPGLFRKCLMHVRPIVPGGWLLVTNSVLVIGEHAAGETDSSRYRKPQGQIRMCVHCRSSKRTALGERWDFVAENLTQLPNLRFELCSASQEYFYPSRREWRLIARELARETNRNRIRELMEELSSAFEEQHPKKRKGEKPNV